MAFSVRDQATDAAVRQLARIKNKGLTETVREAVENELRRTQEEASLTERLKAIGDRFATYPRTGKRANKAFFDDLGG